MSQREQARLQVLNRVMEGVYGMEEVAKVLGVSERHGWRLLAAYRKGAQGSGGDGQGPDHEGARPQAGKTPTPRKPGPITPGADLY